MYEYVYDIITITQRRCCCRPAVPRAQPHLACAATSASVVEGGVLRKFFRKREKPPYDIAQNTKESFVRGFSGN